MKNTNHITLLDAIECVASKSEGSELKDEFFTDCKDELALLAESYGITPRQVVFFAVCLAGNHYSIDYRRLAEHLGISRIRILAFSSDIDALVRRRLLRYNSHTHDEFSVPVPVIRELKRGNAYRMPADTGLNCCELFDRLKMLFEDLDADAIDTDELGAELEHLFDQNPQVEFARKVSKMELDVLDKMLLVLFCHELVNEDNDNIKFFEMEKLFFSKGVFMKERSALGNDNHPLIRQKLIEQCCVDGIADNTSFCLTEHAKTTLLAELNIPPRTENVAQLLSSDSITAKELFYSDSVNRQVEELTALLGVEQYNEVQERMKKSGFRQGFACLFHGGPGTGKTETVYQLARRTGRQVMVVNVPEIKSKWVGESEKNIKALFERYRTLVKKLSVAPILLFNEADAIIGIRKQGADNAVDKMENTIQNIILQEMETLEGILIATTNLTENLDSAFERRFLYKICFEKPDAAVRSKIWHTMIPELPLEVTDIFAGEYDFSGGQIENIARKYAVHSILHGDVDNPQYAIEELCRNERMGNSATRRIGFVA